MKNAETNLQTEIQIALCALPNCHCFRKQVGRFWQGRPAQLNGKTILTNIRAVNSGVPGESDLYGHINGRAFFLEVKTETGKSTSEQERFITAMRESGAIAAVVRDVDSAIKAVLNE